MANRKIRIFLSLVEVSGYYSNLKNGFKKIGFEADTGFIVNHKFGYNCEPHNYLQAIILKVSSKLKKRNFAFLNKFYIGIMSVLMIPYFLMSLKKYDVFIFGFGKSFIPFNLDLPIIKFFNKKVIFIYHGSDSRPPYMDGAINSSDINFIYKKTHKTYKSIEFIEKYADYIVTQPAISLFHEKKVIDWVKIGMPCSIVGNEQITTQKEGVIILHSPSNPTAKGTFIIREVISELKEEGYKLTYLELINKSNKQVIDSIKKCSFVIDQLYSDIPLAGFATEAALLGKVAIVGGYDLDYFKTKNFTIPSYIIKPTKEDLRKATLELINNKNLREELGANAQKFVKKNYLDTEVAKKFIDIIKGTVSKDFYVDPKKWNFLNGCCIEQNMRKKIMKEYISQFGKKALYLSKKPNLEKTILDEITLYK